MTPGGPRGPGRLGAARVFSVAGFRRILRAPAGRITNQTLLVALVLVFGTGVATVAIGSPSGRWAAIAHGIAGLVILLLVPWKSRVIRGGLRRGPGDLTARAGELSRGGDAGPFGTKLRRVVGTAVRLDAWGRRRRGGRPQRLRRSGHRPRRAGAPAGLLDGPRDPVLGPPGTRCVRASAAMFTSPASLNAYAGVHVSPPLSGACHAVPADPTG
jgi:hypothetical protein